jgi:general secretion pathway protein G
MRIRHIYADFIANGDYAAYHKLWRLTMKKRLAGFTFIETLAAISIGAILAAGTSVSVLKAIDFARKTSTQNQIAAFKAALQTYYIDCGVFPTDAQGLEALWEKPVMSPVPDAWDGPYVDREIKTDPWDNAYRYAAEELSGGGKLPWTIISFGADGKEGGTGSNADIFSWK